MPRFITIILFIATTYIQCFGQQPEVIAAVDMSNDSLLHALGYRYTVENVGKNFSPLNVTDAQFEQILTRIKKLKTKIYAVNIFLPGSLKVVGPTVDENAILRYTEVVFQRCQRAGIKMIVWGSSGSRSLPEGFDPAVATAQFISIAKKIAQQASPYKITLVLENLNRTETNFITTLKEAGEIAAAVNMPNFRICADIYHMLKENEPASVIKQVGKYIVHCDIAEKQNRTPPGTEGDDFTPYLVALKSIGYKGKIAMECRWDNLTTQLGPAREYLQTEIKKAKPN